MTIYLGYALMVVREKNDEKLLVNLTIELYSRDDLVALMLKAQTSGNNDSDTMPSLECNCGLLLPIIHKRKMPISGIRKRKS